MASFDSKVRNQLAKPLMLKDYLLDDMSSCSSNGFRSCPRRQCFTTVRFLLEIDLKNRDSNKRVLRTKSKTTSAFQRASEAVVNAVKLLPFTSVDKSPSKQNKTKRTFLPKSLSKKLLKRSFWKKTSNEIQRWKSFRSLVDDEHKPLDCSLNVTTVTESNSSTSQSNSNSNSWSDSDFTVDYLQCENDVVVSENSLPEKVVSGRGGVKDGDDSTEATTTATNSVVQCNKEQWPNEEEKEQFSPVSVLDFPFDHEEEVSSRCFQSRPVRLQGTKQQLLKKIQSFERLAQLEAVDLEKQFSESQFSDENESLKSPPHSCSVSIQDNTILEEEEEEEEIERKVLELVELMKTTIFPSTSLKFIENSLLLEDYFRERISEGYNEVKVIGDKLDYYELLKEAKDNWMNGQNSELLLSWEVEKNRQSYLKDMEKGGIWRNLDDEDKEEVAMELEVEVFDSLVHELLLDLMSF